MDLIEYTFAERDFDKAVNFAVDYYLDPSKSPSGRTSGEPRGLGAVMDAFMRGKLVEIGAQKILEKANTSKQCELNFDIMSVNKVKDEPDIVSILENGKRRDPKLFVEIKNTSQSDRWLGLTEEQLATMEKSSKDREIYIMYISLSYDEVETDNWKTGDLVGMYLKHISNHCCFSQFAQLEAKAKLEHVITGIDLKKYGARFLEGDLLYETNLFAELECSALWDSSDNLRSRVALSEAKKNYRGQIGIPRWDGKVDPKFGQFNISGNFDIYIKKNPKSRPAYIYCLSDTSVSSETFGTFQLKKDRLYAFTMFTLGWDPKLKRNNLWLSKKRIKELAADGKICKPREGARNIANSI